MAISSLHATDDVHHHLHHHHHHTTAHSKLTPIQTTLFSDATHVYLPTDDDFNASAQKSRKKQRLLNSALPLRAFNSRPRLQTDDTVICTANSNTTATGKVTVRAHHVHQYLHRKIQAHDEHPYNTLQRKIIPSACLYLDVSWHDWCAASMYAFQRFRSSAAEHEQLNDAQERQYLSKQITDCVQRQHCHATMHRSPATPTATPLHLLPTLSCRSALDLYLTVKQYPAGSYILMSAINIPDISAVLRTHNLIPVPVDIESVTTLAPSAEVLHKAVIACGKDWRTGRSRCAALMIAHIYGRRVDMTPYAGLAQLHNIDLIEDAAEAFIGFAYLGHELSDLTFFSFGSIKTNTAFGGGLVRIRDLTVWQQMQSLQQQWPAQTQKEWMTKVTKNTAIMILLNIPLASYSTMAASHALGIDHKSFVVSMLRGFPGDQLMPKLRHQPSAALLRMMLRRFEQFQSASIEANTAKCDLLIDLLPDSCLIPGVAAYARDHWLFPVVVSNPQQALTQLNKFGVDAYRGATQLALVQQPERHELPYDSCSNGQITPYPRVADQMMNNIIYLPMHKHVKPHHIAQLAYVIHSVLPRTDTPTPDQQTLLNQPPAGPQLLRSSL